MPRLLIKRGPDPEEPHRAVVRPDQFPLNQELLQLSVAGEQYWDEAWSKFKAGLAAASVQPRCAAWTPGALLALPGVVWLTVFFLLAFYAVVAVAFGNQNTLSEPVPFWNPLDWNVGYMLDDAREHLARRASS